MTVNALPVNALLERNAAILHETLPLIAQLETIAARKRAMNDHTARVIAKLQEARSAAGTTGTHKMTSTLPRSGPSEERGAKRAHAADAQASGVSEKRTN